MGNKGSPPNLATNLTRLDASSSPLFFLYFSLLSLFFLISLISNPIWVSDSSLSVYYLTFSDTLLPEDEPEARPRSQSVSLEPYPSGDHQSPSYKVTRPHHGRSIVAILSRCGAELAGTNFF
jgi:hypothetical protein